MNAAEKNNYRLYEISNDNGYTWEQRYLTERQANILCQNYYRVREVKFGFELIREVDLC